MVRLIDADTLNYVRVRIYHDDGTIGGYNAVVPSSEIKNAPTVDAEPVIRCKDCQYWMKNPYRESSVFGLCFKHKDIAIATDETDWCSWAERREE